MNVPVKRNKQLNIVHVATEYFPYIKTGGMAFVISDLTTNLAKQGCNVTIFLPLFGSAHKKIKELQEVFKDVPLIIDKTTELTFTCQKYVRLTSLNSSVTIYFINHYNFFGRYRRNFYQHKDMPKRFYFYCKAVIKVIDMLNLSIDVLHLHDWMTGLMPELIQEYSKEKFKKRNKIKTLLTIHNLAFQGSNEVNIHRFDKPKKIIKNQPLPLFTDNKKWQKINFLRHGIFYANLISTVSSTYAEEILTPKYGEGLSSLLRKKKPIYGIVNGIDYYLNNPLTSRFVKYKYNTLNFKIQKKNNKIKLLTALKFRKRFYNYPLLITTHRLAYQKGFDLIVNNIDELMKMDLLLIILGDGDSRYVKDFKELSKKYTSKFRFITPFSDSTEQTLFGSADYILCPSVYEPCGISHLRAMRYGVVPIAREVGGLADTIFDYDIRFNSGTGFLFKDYSNESFIDGVRRGLSFYKSLKWNDLVRRCMLQSFSWDHRVDEYITLYKLLRKS